MSRRNDPNPFVTITSTGGLLPTPLLQRLTSDTSDLDGTNPSDYHLLPGKKLRDIINRSWNDLQGVWTSYQAQLGQAVSGDPATKLTVERWILPLLRELGFDSVAPANNTGRLFVEDGTLQGGQREWPITHEWGGRVALHLLGANVPLDRRTPGVHGADNASPHSNVQDFLNASDDHLWAIVTNGQQLRILRDSTSLTRQAYVEFDLATMFDNEVFADFTVLWMLAHRTRFEGKTASGCWLETWQNTSHEQGVRALEDLRQGVQHAIEQLGTGLLSHPANTHLREQLKTGQLDKQDYYRQLLRIVYRLVFLFVIEDRDLLHPPDTDPKLRRRYAEHYSTARLRTQARTHTGGRHPDAWQHLMTLINGLASPDGIPALGLPTLAGGLFDPQWTTDVDNTQMHNRHLYAAIRSLAYTQRQGLLHRIDYRNLGSEELGSVYESLLELHPDIDPDARTVSLDTTAGNERKTTGAYYTPTSLIKVILDEALEPVVDQAVQGKNRTEAEQALLSLTVCDPAMGSAHFLVAAAHRLAKRLATIRTGDIEPDPIHVQQALRDVTSRCIYGVDINPMAVELAKISLWLECHVAGQPLTFLDHHLKCGNALLGVGFDPGLIDWAQTASKAADQKGVPDAAFKPLAGDDKTIARQFRDRNKKRRSGGGQLKIGAPTHQDRLDQLATRARQLDELADDNPDALAAKRRAWQSSQYDPELLRQRLRADAWMASWTFAKTAQATAPLVSDNPLAHDDLPWDVYYDTFLDQDLDPERPGIHAVNAEANRLAFFHWHLEFPNIAAQGGFGLMIGNPPWERIKLQEKEWFAAAGYPDVANAPNAAARKRAITALATSDDPADRQTAQRWQLDSRDAQATSEFARNGERFPYGGVGDVNTYALFADHFTEAVAPWGRVGIIVPTGLVTDYTYREFFAHLVDQRRLVAAYDFINKRGLFPEVAPPMRFVTLVASAPRKADKARFAFMVYDPIELDDDSRSYILTPEQIALVNPNTKTAPVFLDPRDADITTKIYQRHPVLIDHSREDGNPWNIKFSTMFHMANDSGMFRTADQLSADGWTLIGNIYERDGERMLPLYEAKLFRHFDADHNTYEGVPESRKFNVKAGVNRTDRAAQKVMQPRYWVAEQQVQDALVKKWGEVGPYLAWRDITNVTTNQRTTITAMLPAFAANDKCLLARTGSLRDDLLVLACWASFAFDYVARQKVGGTQMKYFLMEQLPVLAPQVFEEPLPWGKEEAVGSWVAARSAALSATSPTLATSLGYATAPSWDDRLREVWRTELDAAMFHLYGYSRDEVAYVMDTFPIVAKNDRKAEGLADDDPNWRTKRLILEKYDELSAHAAAGTTYVSPDPPPPLPEKLRLDIDGSLEAEATTTGR